MFYEPMNFIRRLNRGNYIFQTEFFKFGGYLGVCKVSNIQYFSSILGMLGNKHTGTWGVNTTCSAGNARP